LWLTVQNLVADLVQEFVHGLADALEAPRLGRRQIRA